MSFTFMNTFNKVSTRVNSGDDILYYFVIIHTDVKRKSAYLKDNNIILSHRDNHNRYLLQEGFNMGRNCF